MNIVFDIGNVLIRWDGHLAFQTEQRDHAAVAAFMKRIKFFALNLRADGGTNFAALAETIEDPEDRALFLSYPSHFALSIAEAIEGSWALMERLRAKGHRIHAITNWSAETWPIGLQLHPRLAAAFEVLIVSGEVGILKPDARVFDLLCTRAEVTPAECLFIDDSESNVLGARECGIDAIQFTTPAALEAALQSRGLL